MSELSIVQQKIFELRGRWVILDRDLAVMYGVTTSALNQAVKRNIKRFPPDFMFQLTTEETQRADTQRVGFFFCLRTIPPHGSPPYRVISVRPPSTLCGFRFAKAHEALCVFLRCRSSAEAVRTALQSQTVRLSPASTRRDGKSSKDGFPTLSPGPSLVSYWLPPPRSSHPSHKQKQEK